MWADYTMTHTCIADHPSLHSQSYEVYTAIQHPSPLFLYLCFFIYVYNAAARFLFLRVRVYKTEDFDALRA